MAARICPQCMKTIPVGCAVAFTNGMNCPHCQARVEVGSGSRGVATFAGLAAGWLVWRATSGGSGYLAAVLPELYAIVVFGIVSAVILMFTADLRPAPPVVEAPPASHGHAPSHH